MSSIDQSIEFPHAKRHFWQRWPWIWFIIPALLAYTALFIYPTARAFYYSVFDWTGIGSVGSTVGLDNFQEILHDHDFWNAARNSGKLFLAIFVLQNTISLGLALLLNRKTRMSHVYRAIIFLPVVISSVSTGIMWVLLLDPKIGVITPFFRNVAPLGIDLSSLGRLWQADPDWAMKTLYFVQFWQWNGMAVVVYLAGLQNIPEDLKQAALVDGAKRWQIFRDITFPMLAPSFTILTVLSFVLIFRAFDLPYVLTGPQGAPNHTTMLLGVKIYGDAFGTSGFHTDTKLSYAIAEGVMLFVFLSSFSGILLKGFSRREESIQ